VDGIDHHDLVDPTAADEILEHALHMEEPIQIANCNQLRSFGEAPAAVYFAASECCIRLFTWDPGGIRTAGSAFQVIHVEGGKHPGIMAEEIKIICYFFCHHNKKPRCKRLVSRY